MKLLHLPLYQFLGTSVVMVANVDSYLEELEFKVDTVVMKKEIWT